MEKAVGYNYESDDDHATHDSRYRYLSARSTSRLGAGCGGGQTSSTSATTGQADPDSQEAPGFVVECRTDLTGDQLACISWADWGCPARDYYIREAICADLWGGTPANYDGKVKLSEDPRFEGYYDCANLPSPAADDPMTEDVDETVPEIRQGYAWGGEGCNEYCRICNAQLAGWWNDGAPDDAWNEWPGCPGKSMDPLGHPTPDYEALEYFCDPGATDSGEPEPTTGMPAPEMWICNGSPTICGVMTDSFPPVTMDDICMPPGLVPDCVKATAASAQSECHDLCVLKNAGHKKDAKLSETKTWYPEFPCDELNNFTPSLAEDPLTMCSGAGPMHLENALPFASLAELTLGDGTASSNDLSGLLDFDVGTCPTGAATCDVTISDLRAAASSLHGVYTTRDGAGAPASVPFTVSDVEVRLLQPVLGELKPRYGSVTFPGEDLFFVLSAGTTTLDGLPLSEGMDDAFFVVQGARGTWDGQQLTLDLNWDSQGMTLWLQIRAG